MKDTNMKSEAAPRGNSKFEIRNPKQILMTKIQSAAPSAPAFRSSMLRTLSNMKGHR